MILYDVCKQCCCDTFFPLTGHQGLGGGRDGNVRGREEAAHRAARARIRRAGNLCHLKKCIPIIKMTI